MQAIHWNGREIRVCERPDPEPGEGEVIVEVRLAGVCNTDLEIARGYMGFTGVLGHELVGVVAAGPSEWLGRRVVSEINFACGDLEHCESCRTGLGRHCPGRRVMGILDADGAFAERVAVPVANLHAVPDPVCDEDAVFAEPLAAAFEILEQLALSASDWREQRALVLGDGKLGLLVAQVLQRAGARVTAVGRHPDKLAILARRGIETRLQADWTASQRFDLCVEASGSSAGFEAAVAATRPRGTLVLKSTVAGRHELDLAPIVIDEIQVLGSRCGPFAPALEALAAGEIDVASLVQEQMPLARGDDALRRAAERGARKVLVDCS